MEADTPDAMASDSPDNDDGYPDFLPAENQTANVTTETGVNRAGHTIYSIWQTEQLVTLWVLFVFIIVGNSLVLLIMWLERNKRSRMNFFILNLAIADLSAGLFNVLPDIVHRFVVEWIAGSGLCKIVKYAQAVLLYASTYVLVAMSIDRYDAIVHPLQFVREHKSKVMICVAWGLSCLFSIPSLVIFAVRQQPNGEWQCWGEWPEDWYWVPYMTIIAVIVFFIPLGIISICYIAIIIKIWKRGKGMAYEGHIPRSRGSSDQDSIWLHAHHLDVRDPLKKQAKWSPDTQRRCSSSAFSGRAKVKTIKLSVAIILAFICCWSPYFLFDIMDNYRALPDSTAKRQASYIIQNLPALNSAINPIIYGFFSTKLYRKLRKIAVINWIAVNIFRVPETPPEDTKSGRRPGTIESTAGAQLDRPTALTDVSAETSPGFQGRKTSKEKMASDGGSSNQLCPRSGSVGLHTTHSRSSRLLQVHTRSLEDAPVSPSRHPPPIALCIITEQGRRLSNLEDRTQQNAFESASPHSLLRRSMSVSEVTSSV